MIPIALSIAGSDCSAGAGAQADLKTLTSHGVHGLTALTCAVAESPLEVVSIHPIPPIILQDQLRCLLSTYPIGAAKTGMLCSKAHIVATTELLEGKNIPLVVDPVMVATAGTPLVANDAIAAYKDRLLPIATLVTPNMPEASVLLGRPVETVEDLEPAARDISEQFGLSCLVKGGHLPGTGERTDILWHAGEAHQFHAEMIDIACTHGTGCTLSASITAGMAKGLDLPTAVQQAHAWVHQAIATTHQWPTPTEGKVHCLNHFPQD